MNNYFTHIEDCTVYAWNKAINGELKHLRLDDKGTPEQDVEAWDMVYDSYIQVLGLGKDYIRLLELQSELAEVQLTYIIDNNRILLNKINLLESEINDLIGNKSGEGQDMTTTLIMVTKWIGSKVDHKNTTILELYKMLDLIKKEADAKK